MGQLLPLTRNAFTLAISSNRCAHLAIPVNIQQEFITARTHFCLGTTYQLLQSVPATKVQLDALVMALRTEILANRNVLIACGYRANSNGLGRHIERLAELLHAPILTSYDGKGTVDENHPLSFGGKFLHVGTFGDTFVARLYFIHITNFIVNSTPCRGFYKLLGCTETQGLTVHLICLNSVIQ